jgi:hypothetical protein
MSTPAAGNLTNNTNLTPSWVKQSFLLRSQDLAAIDQQNRFFTSASLKYTDTTPGGNHAINPPPQFTRFADPKAGSRFAGSKGLGIYYSEAIDDHSQLIHMSFGVPEFNSMTQFFTNFYNTGAATLARTGRDPNGIMYMIGRAAYAVVAVAFWPLAAIHLAGMALRFLSEKPSTKYYYLKRTMPVYWQVVTTIVNQIAVNKGIIQRQISTPASSGIDPINDATGGDPNYNAGTDLSNSYQFGADQGANGLQALNNLAMQMQLPDIFMPGGGIDVYAMANRAKRLEQQQIKQYYQALNDTQGTLDLGTTIQQIFSPNNMLTDTTKINFLQYLDKWRQTPAGIASSSETAIAGDSNNDGTTEGIDPSTANATSLGTFFQAELDDGGAYVTFRVNATGAVTDTFSNTAADSELANQINSMSSQSRSTRFDLEDGDISDGGIAKVAGHLAKGLSDIVSGFAAGFGLSGIAALGGSAFVDIPKHWQAATANLSRSTYTMNLVSPYGNPISQLINLYIPVAMLIAGTLPLATGQQSYTSPFICELYDRGRCQIRLGMIDSLSVTRGTSNLAFDENGNALAIDVTFTVLDLSNLVYLPISQGMTSAASSLLASIGVAGGEAAGVLNYVSGSGTSLASDVANQAADSGSAAADVGAVPDGVSNLVTSLNGLFDGDNPFSDYMAVLGGLGLADQIYVLRRFKLNLTMQMAQWRSWKSPARYASMMGDNLPARLIKGFFAGVDNN